MGVTRKRFAKGDKLSVLERQGWCCAICGRPIAKWSETDFDHEHALELGGPDTLDNLRALHRDPCHRDKTRADQKAIAKVRRLQKQQTQGRGRKRRGRPIRGLSMSEQRRRVKAWANDRDPNT